MALLYSSIQSADLLSRALIKTVGGVGDGVLRAILALDERVELRDRGAGL